LSIIDPETKQPLAVTLWPQHPNYWHPSGWSSSPLIATPKPFMCMPGIREYHTHHSHVGDSWENHKSHSDYSVIGIVTQVAQVFQKSNV
jgi:hypothetical protein